jgi:hypothetical protein
MTRCEFSEFDQRFGSAASFSISASCVRTRGASKILLQLADFFAEFNVFLLEFFNHPGAFLSIR